MQVVERRLIWSGATVRVLDARPVQMPRARIVVVHGYGEHAGRYSELASRLASKDIAVTAFDLPGHGQSAGVPGDLGGFENLDELLEMVCQASGSSNGDVPLAVLGHSLGGLIVAGFAARNPAIADALIFSAPVLGRWAAIEALEGLDTIPPSMVRARHLSSVASFASEYDEDALIYRGPVHRSVLVRAKEQLAALGAENSLSEQRMLWLHGSADRIVPLSDALRGFADLSPQALTARIFESARHEVFNDHSREDAIEFVRGYVRSLPHPESQKIGEPR